MTGSDLELLAIGAGPANLGLAVALEELAPQLARETLIVEQHSDVVWQRGMLLPWAQSQVSFLKDLVTRRNPRSRYSFVNYLHCIGRLDDFINLGSFTPYRVEISDYLRWVSQSLEQVEIEYERRCVGLAPIDGGERWAARFDDGSEVTCRHVVIGAGREAHVPAEFAGLPADRVVHSTEFSWRTSGLERDAPHRVVVIGGAQSAAEMLWAMHEGFPNAQCTMVMRSIGLANYESSKFTNELFYPSFVDEFHAAPDEVREQLLREMHRTNYSGLAPSLLEALYRRMYLDRMTGTGRLEIVTTSDVLAAHMDGDEVVLAVSDRKTERLDELRCDRVLLGTGFRGGMPEIVRDLAATIGLDTVDVSRRYRMAAPESISATCHLQGVNEATHGIADSLLSVLASRSEDIVQDVLEARRTALPQLVASA
ncbi:MAG: L-ornithine N5-monooxygenase [Solirubrobacteraceae bacterium]|nr:L-ornithine N5-monooxygenase [Solirubrobacteraceae bacterium]